MKQLLQSISTGQAKVVDVPAPRAGRGQVLVRVHYSLVSAGTERMVMEFAEKNLVQKAMARPDLVKQVVEKAKREGWLATIDTVRNRLDSDMVLGYSNAGVVIEVGEGVTEITVGDRVACAGGGFATHSEVVRIPRNLVAVVPKDPREVPLEQAAFATVAAIALQGIRLAELQLGEVVAVIGLGLIGQIAVQLALANGCTVIGMDPSADRCKLAERIGCAATASSDEEMIACTGRLSNGRGADCILIAAATESNGPVELAAEIARDRAQVVAVGAVGLTLPRKPYYMKELDFKISRSYGPGRYDPEYEEKGKDYPIGYVRWTEGRNVAAVLQLLASGRLDFGPLITHRFRIDEAVQGYDLISGKTREPFLGIIISYPDEPSLAKRIDIASSASAIHVPSGKISIGVLGAGNFTAATLLPAMKAAGQIEFAGICAPSGTAARSLGKKFGFRFSASDQGELLQDASINTMVVSTRHASHAAQTISALDAGKHVFCEKPLAMDETELAAIVRAYYAQEPRRLLMVGYNRRFAMLAREAKGFFDGVSEPYVMNYRVNAGFIPTDHWTQDPDQGGGRIIGEVCHFVDLLSFICGSNVVAASASLMPDSGRYRGDNLIAALRFDNGSIGSITYAANGDKSFSKELVEMFAQGRVAVLDDYRELRTVRDGKQSVSKIRLRTDKGHRGEWEAMRDAVVAGGPVPIPFHQLMNSTLATIALVQSSRDGSWVGVDTDRFLADALREHPQA
jgi:predicted dehydrogenase